MKILNLIADNPALTDALKELFRKKFSVDDANTNLDNESLGQVVRARIDGLKKVDDAFSEIEKYRTIKEEPVGENPAR